MEDRIEVIPTRPEHFPYEPKNTAFVSSVSGDAYYASTRDVVFFASAISLKIKI